MGTSQDITGPDFSAGFPAASISDGATISGRVGDQSVLLSRRGGRYFAVSGACTHYGAALAGGSIEGDQVRCPWHHACFDLRTGEALAAPAFDSLTTWDVETDGGLVFVRSPSAKPTTPAPSRGGARRIVIIGGGAAGFAAAEMLRRRGFDGALTMLSADASPPYDRPNLSKDYLAGTAPEEWIPLKDESFYHERAIDLKLGVKADAVDVRERIVSTASGERLPFDALLLATGATPVRPPAFAHPNVHVLRTLADSRNIVSAAAGARRVAIVGASFIGLEAAAALRARGLAVHVAAPETTPLENVLGVEIGTHLKKLHESRGVVFHLGRSAASFDSRRLLLDDGSAIEADFVILGVGVRPSIELAAKAGIATADGVVVDSHLRTSAPNIFAAGDIASYPDARLGERIRVEHWVAAEQQGQAAALSMLGEPAPFRSTPFFWSNHYEHNIRYVGRAARWDAVQFEGSPEDFDFTARYFAQGRLLAAASAGRDRENAELHAEMDREAAPA